MKKILLFIFVLSAISAATAQETLPKISAINYDGKILISWKNNYTLPIANISIQRSYDSSRNYTTIGTVLNPQSMENGYSDPAPPYDRMYYRLFIAFEGGSYLHTPAVKPVKEIYADTVTTSYPWQVDPTKDSAFQSAPVIVPDKPEKPKVIYPSTRIFTAKDNNVVINLPQNPGKNYSIKFYRENGSLLFEIKDVKEDFLIIERVNFIKSGWFTFELFEDGLLLEKNKFFIAKDGKTNNGDAPRR